MKQYKIFNIQAEDSGYSKKIQAPLYEPKNKKPHIFSLVDKLKSNQLIREIEGSNLLKEEKEFLIEAAKRHLVFNYELIADYYSHASKEMQNLMERSALVIIDFNRAIELGYVKVSSDLKAQYLEEYE